MIFLLLFFIFHTIAYVNNFLYKYRLISQLILKNGLWYSYTAYYKTPNRAGAALGRPLPAGPAIDVVGNSFS